MNLIKRYWPALIVGSLLLFSAWLVYLKLHPKPLPDHLVAGTGRIDGDLIVLSAKYPGRVESILVQEGEAVKKGQIVAVLGSEEIDARLKGSRAQVCSAESEIGALEDELAMARTSLLAALEAAKRGVEVAKAQKNALEREADALELSVAQEKKDYERFRGLFAQKLIESHKVEMAQLSLQTKKEQLGALKERIRQAEESVEIANQKLKAAEADMGKIDVLQQKIGSAKEILAVYVAAKEELEAMKKELTIIAPCDGFIVERVANPGEVVSSGMALATMIDPAQLYLKMYVDTLQNGRIKIGDQAVIFLDGAPDLPIAASVVRIASRAEFTPKEVNVKNDRIQRMFAVHLKPLKETPLLKLGLPAVGVISVNGGPLPQNSEVLGEL